MNQECKKKINIAVIGSFWLPEKMIEVINKSDNASYCAQYSRKLSHADEFVKKIGQKKDIKLYDNIIDLANDKTIDAVYIASPNYMHFSQSKLLLNAGKHILCEKPICVYPWEYDKLCEISNNRKLIYLEAMMNAHLPWISRIKELINENEIVSANLNFCQRSSKLQLLNEGIVASTFSKECFGGALMDLGVYVLSFVYQLFGKPQDIKANSIFGETKIDVTDNLLIKYNNFSVNAVISKIASSIMPSEIITKKGSIIIENISRLENVKYYHNSGDIENISEEVNFEKSLSLELEDFISYINNPDNPEYIKNIENSKNTVNMLYNIRKSIGYEQ